MKQLKYYAMALAALAFAACSDDEEVAMNNTSATVGFENAQVTYNENAGLITVPFVVEGEQNGAIRVNFSVQAGTAVENEHYIVTTNTILIPADDNTGYGCEIRLIDDDMTENDDRTLTITINSVEGASVGTNSTCQMTIADVDKDPYYKLMGTYTLSAVDAYNGGNVSFTVTLTGGSTLEEQEANEHKRYVAVGFDNSVTTNESWIIEYNESSQQLTVVQGDFFATGLNFGSFIGSVAIIPMTSDANEATELVGTWSEDFNSITFDEGGLLGVGVYDDNSGQYMGFYSVYGNVVMTKQ